MTDESIFKVIKEVAMEQGISPTVLDKAWRNQFKVLKDVTVSAVKDDADTFKAVYIKNMGKFIPNRDKIRRVSGLKKLKNERKSKTDSRGVEECGDKGSTCGD
jgi:hypothetical protein